MVLYFDFFDVWRVYNFCSLMVLGVLIIGRVKRFIII